MCVSDSYITQWNWLIDISDEPRWENGKTGSRPWRLVGNFPYMPQSPAFTQSHLFNRGWGLQTRSQVSRFRCLLACPSRCGLLCQHTHQSLNHNHHHIILASHLSPCGVVRLLGTWVRTRDVRWQIDICCRTHIRWGYSQRHSQMQGLSVCHSWILKSVNPCSFQSKLSIKVVNSFIKNTPSINQICQFNRKTSWPSVNQN